MLISVNRLGTKLCRSFDGTNQRGLLLLMTVLLIGFFYILTIRNGHDWGDDFSMYIQHAKNIVQGDRYAYTSYIYFPPYGGPDSYPPMFPLFLVPVTWLFAMNFMAMKVAVVLVFTVALLLLAQVVKDFMPVIEQVVLLILVGFNPYFWNFKDNIVSEILFLAAVCLSIWLVQKFYESNVTSWAKLGYVLATGASFYLAYGTRSAGLILLPCLLLYDLFRKRGLSWPSLYSIGVVAVTIALIVLQSFVLRSDRGYVEQVQPGSQNFLYNWLVFILQNIPRYMFSLTELWDNTYSKLFRISLTVFMSALAVIGFLAQARRKITFLEVFVSLYAVGIVIVPMTGGIRYMLPIVPFYMFYSLQGIKDLPQKDNVRKYVATVAAIAVVVAYALSYTAQSYGEIPNGITKAEATDIFDYVKKQTSENDVIIFTKPRALALFTGRKVSIYPLMENDKEFWEYFNKIRATHIIIGPNGEEPYNQAFLKGFVDRNTDFLRKDYANADFVVYRIINMPNADSQNGVKSERN